LVMKLTELAAHLPGAEMIGSGDAEFSAVEYDSRRVRPGALFVAVPGFRADGHDYLRQSGLKVIGLNNQCRTCFGCPQIGMGKEH